MGNRDINVLQDSDSGQRKDESSKAFEAFVMWRDMGPERSYPNVARKLSKSATLIKRWGARFRWQERLRNHLQSLDAERVDSQRKAIQEMNERHINAAALFQKKAITRLKSIDIAELAPRDLVRMFELAVGIERSARGLNPGAKLGAVEQVEIQRPVGDIVSDAVKGLSAVDRSLLRDLTIKEMTIFRLESEVGAQENQRTDTKRDESIVEKTIEVSERPQATSDESVKTRRTEWIMDDPIKLLAPFRG